jgi:DNA polymerase I-like protein with 3'-5' exonuclease and polymerase domains
VAGRKRRFPLWEAADYTQRFGPPLTYDQAIQRWKNVVRSNTHKALNALIQGSAADQTKTALIRLASEGLLAEMAVHDEIVTSVASESDALRVGKIMEDAIPCTIPFVCDAEVGPNWAETKKVRGK